MNQLTRVQVYLNPDDLSLIDEIASIIKVRRSQIIRDALRAVTNTYMKTIDLLQTAHKPKTKTWLELAGIGEREAASGSLDR